MSKTILLDQLPTHIENLYQINGICSARSPCLATVCYIKRLLIKSIWYYTQLNPICSARSLGPPRNADFIGKLRIKLIWYYCKQVGKNRRVLSLNIMGSQWQLSFRWTSTGNGTWLRQKRVSELGELDVRYSVL